MIYERPRINPDQIVRTRDGYRARSLCLCDGYPAEVMIDVDTRQRDYSRAAISAFDPVHLVWNQVYSMDAEHLRDLPALPDGEEGFIALNRLAAHLHSVGDVIVSMANERLVAAEAAEEAAKQAAVADMWERRAAAKEAAAAYVPAGDLEVGGESVPVSVKIEEN